MENNDFNKDFDFSQVQKPFTDKTADVHDFSQNSGQNTYANNPVISQNTDSKTNTGEPVLTQNTQHRSDAGEPVFAQNQEDNSFENRCAGPENSQPGANRFSSSYFAQNSGAVQRNDYSNPHYTNNVSQFNNDYKSYGTPASSGSPYTQNGQSNNSQNYAYSGFGNRPPYQPQPYAQYGNGYHKPPKGKVSTGVVVIISVLCALLIFGFIGMAVLVNENVNKGESGKDDNAFYFTVPDNGSETPSIPQSTDPSVQHEESDYSNRVDKDYKGLVLESKPKDADKNSAYTSEYAYNKVSDSVVGVVGYTDKVTTVEDCETQGSGIIISSDGYVVTNSHVIDNSKTSYILQIVTSDGKSYDAGVVGYDSRTDIAVLKMDGAKGLKPAVFGDSNELELGEDIIAVGNPGGLDYQNSITKGIVSALDRKMSSTSLVKYIQTDAAINPGNSGGPIVNLYGQVVGIATSKIVSEQYEGMGFAIPSDTAKGIIDTLIRNGYVEGRVKIGITGTAVTSEAASAYGLPAGISISEITQGGPCDGTALKKGDIITSVGRNKVESFSDVYEILENYNPGDEVEIEYFRPSDMSEGKVEIVLAEDK